MKLKEIDAGFEKLLIDLDQLRLKNINEDDDIDSIEDKLSLVESDIHSLRIDLLEISKFVKELNNEKPENNELLKDLIKNLKNYQLQYRKIQRLIDSGVVFAKSRVSDVFEHVSADLDAILKEIDPQLEKTRQINLDKYESYEELSISSDEDLQSSAEFSSADQEEGYAEISLDQLLKQNIAESSALLSKVNNLIKTIKKSDNTDLHALFKLNRKVGSLLTANEKNNAVLNKYFSVGDSSKHTDSMFRILSEINNEIALLSSDTIPDMVHKAKQDPKRTPKIQSVIKDSVKRLSGKLTRKSSKSWVNDSQGKASAEKTKNRLSSVNSSNNEKTGGKNEP